MSLVPFLRVVVSLLMPSAVALDNGIGLTPPMGFNDWNELSDKYPPWKRWGFNETAVLATARALVDTGLRDKGFKYLNIDCGWSTGHRDGRGSVVANPTQYPSGMKAISDQVHAMGLLFGIYTSGHSCCTPKDADDGILGHEAADVQQFAELGVDYLKNDDCGSTTASFEKVRDLINSTGRRMIYSIHTSWTHGKPGVSPKEAAAVSNVFRTTGDITHTWAAILDRAMQNDKFASLARPGYWNDPDILEVGNSGVSDAEGRSQFALWALMKAPLLIGTDLSVASKETLATLGADEVIAVNQDALGVQGRLVATGGQWQVWAGPLDRSCHVAVLLNLQDSDAPATVSLTWGMLGIPDQTALAVRDLWGRKDLGIFSRSMSTTISVAHDNVMLKLCQHSAQSLTV